MPPADGGSVPGAHEYRDDDAGYGRGWEIRGPVADRPAVDAWADDYIRFEKRPPWQEELRSEIRSRCRQLEPSPDELLHAAFSGSKLANADVENLLLYNIDTFKTAGRNGIRFELGASAPTAPSGTQYSFGYSYALAPLSGTFAHWQQGRTLASFDWTDLGTFVGEKKLAQVWLALARGKVDAHTRVAPGTTFAVRVHVRPPVGPPPVWGGLVKGIFDGVICAFHSHTDPGVLDEAADRLARDLPADPAEIARLLLEPRWAVLGEVNRLVSPYGNGVKWNPADHLCVAGELLAAEPVDSRWAIKGELVEVVR